MDSDSLLGAFGAGVIIGLLIGLIFVKVLMSQEDNEWYELGQINALTGKVHYHLVVQEDSTKVWERIKE